MPKRIHVYMCTYMHALIHYMYTCLVSQLHSAWEQWWWRALIAVATDWGKSSAQKGSIRIGGKQDDVEEHLCVRRPSEARLHLQVCVLIYFITCTCALQIYVCIATYYCSKNGIEKIKCHPYDVIVAIVTCAGASLRVGRATLPRCSRNASLITAFVIHSTPTWAWTWKPPKQVRA